MLGKLWAMARRAKQTDGGFSDLVQACHQLVSERGQANLYVLAEEVVQAWRGLSKAKREAFFAALATEFAPDQEAVLAAAQAYIDEPQAVQLAALAAVTEAPRQELFRRINRVQDGAATLLDMRVALMACMRNREGLEAVNQDFLHLLTSWFNPGMLHFESVSWHSSASLLEKIIHHEAVHAIDSWAHLRRRLEADRRCYAFFHPQLPDEPLIFVEVALTDEMPNAVAPLIATRASAEPVEAGKPTVAVFYSISNCQPGLRGVSLGNFLIKRVAQHLAQEVPSLKTYCTLSPVPGLVRWLDQVDTQALPAALAQAHARVASWRAAHPNMGPEALAQGGASLQEALARLSAYFLVHGSHQRGADPVARFHLDNGARLERINVGGDVSKNGFKQSLSVMVNYLYDLDDVEARHQEFVDRHVSHSRDVRKYLKH
jgi:malonyl-CoA decarboxylase